MTGKDYYEQDLLRMHNILKDKSGDFYLQNNYYLDENKKLKSIVKYDQRDNHRCDTCRYYNKVEERDGYCEIYNKLLNLNDNEFRYCSSLVVNCEAYDEIKELTIINSEQEMIEFVKKIENCFECPEYFEDYFGFERKYDENTGEILETVDEYVSNGGEFKCNFPDKYPAVVYFDCLYPMDKDLKWIYIGKE